MASERETISITLRDADSQVLWSGKIRYQVKLDKFGLLKLTTFAPAILPYTGRDLLPSLARVEAIEITIAGEPTIHVDDVEVERIVATWRRINDSPDQIDWTGTPRQQPQ